MSYGTPDWIARARSRPVPGTEKDSNRSYFDDEGTTVFEEELQCLERPALRAQQSPPVPSPSPQSSKETLAWIAAVRTRPLPENEQGPNRCYFDDKGSPTPIFESELILLEQSALARETPAEKDARLTIALAEKQTEIASLWARLQTTRQETARVQAEAAAIMAKNSAAAAAEERFRATPEGKRVLAEIEAAHSEIARLDEEKKMMSLEIESIAKDTEKNVRNVGLLESFCRAKGLNIWDGSLEAFAVKHPPTPSPLPAPPAPPSRVPRRSSDRRISPGQRVYPNLIKK